MLAHCRTPGLTTTGCAEGLSRREIAAGKFVARDRRRNTPVHHTAASAGELFRRARNGKAPATRKMAIVFRLLTNLDAFSAAVAEVDHCQNSTSKENWIRRGPV